ncbi:MAG: GNAT family N-acetyltransferase [Planctomycetia bacterium]|nr:GNAT family N-acetyltransferase [Planctomycetia bacterium]
MIRPSEPRDTPALVELTARTGFFKPLEVETLREVLDYYHEANRARGHRCFSYERDGVLRGFVYHAPEDMTERTWCLWWIAVAHDEQGRGLGGELLRFAEEDMRQLRGRVLFIETSGTKHYGPTRRFYLKHGYEQEAVLRDYYSDGDDLVMFRKRLTTP